MLFPRGAQSDSTLLRTAVFVRKAFGGLPEVKMTKTRLRCPGCGRPRPISEEISTGLDSSLWLFFIYVYS